MDVNPAQTALERPWRGLEGLAEGAALTVL
jgi:hypothetical protein